MSNENQVTNVAKEKAIELVDKIFSIICEGASLSDKRILYAKAIECAGKFVDAMIQEYTSMNGELINALYRNEKVVFWQAVRVELYFILY